jgi:glycosyltransferase involved in cell wall biosynthesis
VKVAVYDRYWATGGGGEKFAAGIAAALAPDHDVTLLGHEPFDLDWLGERLHIDLSDVAVEQVDANWAHAVGRATAAYDVFVNASYRSGDLNRARRGAYVVHFPGVRPSGFHRAWGWLTGLATERLAPAGATVSVGDGFYGPDWARLHSLNWTCGEADLLVRSAAGGRWPVTLFLGRYVPASVGPVTVTAEVAGEVVGQAVIEAPRSRLEWRKAAPLRFVLDLHADEPVTVTLRSPAWVPADQGSGSDRRRLGVPLLGWQVGRGLGGAIARLAPSLVTRAESLDFLDTYDLLLANSRYTQRWVERMWRRSSRVLYPPVTLMARSDKRKLVLSVGRFFTPGSGHNKKQLEMVGAFRRLAQGGRAEGWEYHLVGGCTPEHQGYLDRVRAEGAGLPVVVHPDASGAELRRLYGEASIFWHAAGLGESAERHPDRSEHFGITTVEAMSAGAVPVVIDGGGQAEIVEQGVSGYRFRGVDDLVRRTQELIDDADRRETMSAAAEQRAQALGWDAFAANVRRELHLT